MFFRHIIEANIKLFFQILKLCLKVDEDIKKCVIIKKTVVYTLVNKPKKLNKKIFSLDFNFFVSCIVYNTAVI
jgi:hypothetical protein